MSEDKKDFVVKDKRRLAETEPDTQPAGEPSQEPAGESAQETGDTTDQESGSSAPAQLPQIDFATFVFSLNSAVLVHIGVMDDPASGQPAKDLPMAKQTIDILGMLEEKTRGNLTSDEENMLKNILYDLRIRYVRETG